MMNTEDQKNNQPTATAPGTESETKTKSNSNNKISGLNSTLRNIGFGFLFLLLGALIVGVALYLPANSKLGTAETELDRLRPIETAYEDLLVEFDQVSIQRVVYKIFANASQMQVALINDDSGRITQYLQYIEDDLSSLSIPDFPDVPASLQEQFAIVADKRVTDKSGALAALQVFQNDLLLLIDNLE
jgi:hypothetical protein